MNLALKFLLCLDIMMNPLFHTDFSISDSLKFVRKSVLIYEAIIFVHGQDVMTKLAPFLFYSSIYNKFYIMMRYIFKAIRLYPLNKTMEEELEILEENLLQLSEII